MNGDESSSNNSSNSAQRRPPDPAGYKVKKLLEEEEDITLPDAHTLKTLKPPEESGCCTLRNQRSEMSLRKGRTYAELIGTAIPSRLVTMSTIPCFRWALMKDKSLFCRSYLLRYSLAAAIRSARETAKRERNHNLRRAR